MLETQLIHFDIAQQGATVKCVHAPVASIGRSSGGLFKASSYDEPLFSDDHPLKKGDSVVKGVTYLCELFGLEEVGIVDRVIGSEKKFN